MSKYMVAHFSHMEGTLRQWQYEGNSAIEVLREHLLKIYVPESGSADYDEWREEIETCQSLHELLWNLVSDEDVFEITEIV